MIKTETKTINGRTFDYTYSDAGYFIERDGVEYAEAYDPAGSGRTYTETEHKIDDEDPDGGFLDDLIAEVKAYE